jgi:4-amino-4-deoxy-L-arabinose transferase-like glycosyltransferase
MRLDVNTSTWKPVLLLTGLCAAVFLAAAWQIPLADPEESRCVLVVQHMQDTGQWIVPHLHGEPYYDKPAPFFWLAAAGQWLTGDIELGGRLVAAVFAYFGVLGAFALARREAGPAAGLIAGITVATSGLYVFQARWYRMDMPFAASMWLAMVCFWLAERRRLDGDEKAKHSGWLGFYAWCALATVFKGPAGLVLPGAVVFVYLLLSGRWKRVFEFIHIPSLILYLLIAAPWFVAMGYQQPGYLQEFFLGQNVGRFASSMESHGMNPMIYIPVLLAGLLPWTIYLPGACIRLLPRRWRDRNTRPVLMFCWLAAIIPLLFFMAASTRLANYVLPCIPPLAVLCGMLIAQWIANPHRDVLLIHGARAMVGLVLLLAGAAVAGMVYFGVFSLWAILPGIVILVALVMMVVTLIRDHRGRFVACATAAVTGWYWLVATQLGAVAYSQYMSSRTLALQVPAGSVVAFWSARPMSFLCYARPSVAMEMDDDSPEQEFPRLAALVAEHGGAWVYVSSEAERDTLIDYFGDAASHEATDGTRFLYRIGGAESNEIDTNP